MYIRIDDNDFLVGLNVAGYTVCIVRRGCFIFRLMMWPGLMLQKLTTKEPDSSQLEVALASLKQVLHLEKGDTARLPQFEIAAVSELGVIQASVSEFPEN